jgi:hypothetical protein
MAGLRDATALVPLRRPFRRLARRTTRRFLLLFALFFTTTAIGQYFYVRHKVLGDTALELHKAASEIAASFGVDWTKISEEENVDFPVASWYVVAANGELVDVAGWVPGFPSRVAAPIDLDSRELQRLASVTGEQFRVLARRVKDVSLLVGAVEDPEDPGAVVSTEYLGRQSDRFAHAVEELTSTGPQPPNYVEALPKISLPCAILGQRGELLALSGGLPLRVDPPELPALAQHGLFSIRGRYFFRESAPVLAAGPSQGPRGWVLVLRPFDGMLKSLRDHALFNLGIAFLSWLVVVIAVAPARQRKRYSVAEAVQKGEGEHIEFKEFLKLDEKGGKSEDYLKTVAAFLNSYGGSLFVGIKDDGTVSGVGPDLDRFGGSRDELQRWVAQKIGSAFGHDVLAFVHLDFDEVDGKVVCRIDVDPSPEPVFWEEKDRPISLIVRAASTSRALNARELADYVRSRWR